MPARGLNLVPDCEKMFFAEEADEHHAGALEVPQKNCQLLCSLRSLRAPRMRPNAGTRLYALLLTLPVVSDRIGMTAYT